MGGIPDGGYQSIHYINLDENYQKINDERIIKINDRVRDLINLNDDDIVLGSTKCLLEYLKYLSQRTKFDKKN